MSFYWPADGIDKGCDEESGADGAAQVDAGQHVDLPVLHLEVVLLQGGAAVAVPSIDVVVSSSSGELRRAVGGSAHQQLFVGQLEALVPAPR